jgi:hypothetical protein
VTELAERLGDEQLPERLLELWPKYLSYVLSFLVILMYWMAYHNTFRAIKRYDRELSKLCVPDAHRVPALPHFLARRVRKPLVSGAELRRQPGRRPPNADRGVVVRLERAASYGRRARPWHDKSLPYRGLTIPLLFLITIGISFFSANATVCSRVLLLVADNMLLRVLSKYGWWVVRTSVSHKLA